MLYFSEIIITQSVLLNDKKELIKKAQKQNLKSIHYQNKLLKHQLINLSKRNSVYKLLEKDV